MPVEPEIEPQVEGYPLKIHIPHPGIDYETAIQTTLDIFAENYPDVKIYSAEATRESAEKTTLTVMCSFEIQNYLDK